MNLGRIGRVGRMIVGRAGRLTLAALLALARSETGQSSRALVCQMKPTRVGSRCFCRGAYGWRIAPAIMCQVAR